MLDTHDLQSIVKSNVDLRAEVNLLKTMVQGLRYDLASLRSQMYDGLLPPEETIPPISQPSKLSVQDIWKASCEFYNINPLTLPGSRHRRVARARQIAIAIAISTTEHHFRHIAMVLGYDAGSSSVNEAIKAMKKKMVVDSTFQADVDTIKAILIPTTDKDTASEEGKRNSS